MAKKRRKIAKKKVRRAPQRQKKSKMRIISPKAKVKQESFALDIDTIGPPSRPARPFAEARLAPHEEIAFDLPKPEALRTIEHKKRIPHAVTALISGAVLAIFSLFVFYSVLDTGELLSFALTAAIFTGFTIFLYGRLEKSG